MNRKLAAILVLVALGLLTQPALAAFENITLSPRARAMGDAGAAVPDAPFASYLNPAGLAAMTPDAALGLSYEKPYQLSFNKLYFLGAAFNLPGRAGALGFGLRQYRVEYEKIDLEKETTFTLSHGFDLYRDLHSSVAFGYGLNVFRLEFGETVGGIDPGSDTAVGLDLGGGAWCNETPSCKRWYHRAGTRRRDRVAFAALHVYPFLAEIVVPPEPPTPITPWALPV